MKKDNAMEMAQISSAKMKDLFEDLKEDCGGDATEVELFAHLMAYQTIVEALTVRLKNMNVDEELIELAVENAKNQVLFFLREKDDVFYMKGEEV